MKVAAQSAAACLAIAVAGFAIAAPITIVNHSFEVDDVSGENNEFNPDILPTGWTDYDDGRNNATAGDARGLVYHGPGSEFSSTIVPNDGLQSFFTAQRDILQVLSATLLPNTTYTLSVAIGDRNKGAAAGAPGTPVVNLGYGNTGGTNILLSLDQNNQPAQINGGWVEWSGQFSTGATDAGLGEVLRIELTNGTNVGWFDNIRLDAVPEPSTLALMVMGAATMFRRRR